jgi:hypothetical protein
MKILHPVGQSWSGCRPHWRRGGVHVASFHITKGKGQETEGGSHADVV